MYDIANALRRRAMAERLEALERARSTRPDAVAHDPDDVAGAAVVPPATAGEVAADPLSPPLGAAPIATAGLLAPQWPVGPPPVPGGDFAARARHRTDPPGDLRRSEPTFPQSAVRGSAPPVEPAGPVSAGPVSAGPVSAGPVSAGPVPAMAELAEPEPMAGSGLPPSPYMTPVSYVQPAATAPYGVGTPLPGRARIDLIPPAPALPRVGTPPAQVPIPPAPSEQNLEQNLSAMAEAVTKLVGPPAQEPEPPEGAPADPDDESPAAVASRPPAVGTAASTIADLLRHGSSQLFFDRSDPDD